VSTTPFANNGNNIRLQTPESELEGNNLYICFLYYPKVTTTPVANLSCKYLCEFSKKIETVLIEYSGAGGKLIHEKNQKQKIS
jgi:hypothetical protein